MASWYALRSKTNKEDVVWRHIEAQGFETYYPRIRVRPVNPRARKIMPYFPGYMFVRTDLAEVGTSVFDRMPHAIGLVGFGGEPVPIEDSLITILQKRLQTLPAMLIDPIYGLKPGDPVLINDGPFAGYTALFDARLPGRERVRVLLQLLNDHGVVLELAPAQIIVARST